MIESFPSLGAVSSLALASFLIELTPGPNMAWLAMVAASEGRKPGFAAVAGVTLGLAIIGAAAALGVAELIEEAPFLYEGLRWGGVTFLFWLAWDGWREAASTVPPTGQSSARYFRRGLVTNLLNPKAALFFLAVVPGFVNPGQPVLAQTLGLSAVYVIVATLVHGAIVSAAGAVRPHLKHLRRQRIIRRVFAVLLALVALWLGFATAR